MKDLMSKSVEVSVREKVQLAKHGNTLPSADWQANQVSDFSLVRMKLARHIEYKRKNPEAGKKRHKLPSKTNEQGSIRSEN